MYDLEGMGEYNNYGDLLGIDGLGELGAALDQMHPVKRAKVISKLAHTAPSKGSRAEMEKHFSELPPHVKRSLEKGELRLADSIIYSIKPVNSKTIKLFETQDTKEIGLTNISGAKLPKNQVFLCSGIILLAGTSADSTKENIMATNFQGIETFPAIVSGEIDLKANKKQIMPETSCYIMKTANNHMRPIGYYKLANPRLITDDVLIELTLQLGTQTGIQNNTYVFGALHGTVTTP